MNPLDVISLATFALLVVVAWFFRIDSRTLVFVGLAVLVVGAIVTLVGYGQEGNLVAIPAFFLLVIGTAKAVVEYTKEQRASPGGSAKGWMRLDRFRNLPQRLSLGAHAWLNNWRKGRNPRS